MGQQPDQGRLARICLGQEAEWDRIFLRRQDHPIFDLMVVIQLYKAVCLHRVYFTLCKIHLRHLTTTQALQLIPFFT